MGGALARQIFDIDCRFGLLACPAAFSAPRTGDSTNAVEALRARCPTTRNLAPEAFSRTANSTVEELDRWQNRIRGNLQAEAPPGDAEVIIRGFAGGSITQTERSETATVLWRLPDGSWQFVAADYYPDRYKTPPPPPAQLTQDQVETAKRSIVHGRLDRRLAEALNAVLADPCLEAEPSIVVQPLPVRAGVQPMRSCLDAAGHTVEVVRAGRRTVYEQSCRYFLAGELIGLAVYPRAEGSVSVAPPSQALASVESARRFADQVLRTSYGSEVWINATEAAGGYAFVHRASGFRCAATRAYEVQVHDRSFYSTTEDGGRCVREAPIPVRRGDRPIKTEWEVSRLKASSDIERNVLAAADAWFSSYHGSAAPRRVRMSRITINGVRMERAEVARQPHFDARQDELTVVLGAAHDGWVVVATAIGSTSDPAAVEGAAAREWRRAVDERVNPPG